MKTVSKFFHSDSGHGWLAVKRKELRDLGIEDKVSPYSYAKGNTVYLEEDCDAPLYINAQKIMFGVKVEIKRAKFQDRSPIRSYDSFRKG